MSEILVIQSTETVEPQKALVKEVETEIDEVVEETTDQDESTDEAGEETAKESDEETEDLAASAKTKKKGGFVKKIAKLTGELSAKEQEIETLRQQLQAKTMEKPKSDLKKPVIDDYETQADFLEALTDYKIEVKAQAEKAAKEQETVKTTLQSKVDKFNANLNEFKKEKADYDDVLNEYVAEHGKIQFSAAIDELLLESDLAPQLIYEIVKDKALVDKLNGLSPLAAAKEFGKLEMGLTKPEKKEIKTKTNAPAPLKTLTPKTATVKKDIYDPNLSYREWEQLMNERENKKRMGL